MSRASHSRWGFHALIATALKGVIPAGSVSLKDTLRTFRQLQKHAEALVQGSANSKYKFEKPYRVLCVFEHNSMMQAVMGRMVESGYFSQLSAHFLFKLLRNITWHDLATGRWEMGKKQVGMLGDATNVFLVRNILIDF